MAQLRNRNAAVAPPAITSVMVRLVQCLGIGSLTRATPAALQNALSTLRGGPPQPAHASTDIWSRSFSSSWKSADHMDRHCEGTARPEERDGYPEIRSFRDLQGRLPQVFQSFS